MTTLITIKHASYDDRDELLALQAHAMRKLGVSYYDGETLEEFIASVGTMDEYLIEDRTYFSVFDGHRIVACGGWTRRVPHYVSRMSGTAALPSIRVGTVRSVFVDPAYARRGIARHLIDVIEDDMVAAGCDAATLSATLPGLPFYKSVGYQSGQAITLKLPNDRLFIAVAMEKRLRERDRMLSVA